MSKHDVSLNRVISNPTPGNNACVDFKIVCGFRKTRMSSFRTAVYDTILPTVNKSNLAYFVKG